MGGRAGRQLSVMQYFYYNADDDDDLREAETVKATAIASDGYGSCPGVGIVVVVFVVSRVLK